MGICRVELFTDQVRKLKTIAKVTRACRAEHEYLQSSYKTISSLKSGFSSYRNYLRASLDGLEVEGKLVLGLALDILRLSKKQQQQYDLDRIKRVIAHRKNLRAITNVGKYLAISRALLSSNSSYLDLVIGLAALSGRRTAEIACSASFEYDSDQSVVFSGQLKLKARQLFSYAIPVLHQPKELIKTLHKLRLAKPELVGQTIKFHDNASSSLNHKVKKYYAGCFEGAPKPKDLRSIYAELCFALFCERDKVATIAKNQYFSHILGHGENDLSTADAYVDFYLNDPNFK